MVAAQTFTGEGPTTALGQKRLQEASLLCHRKRTCAVQLVMSALGQKQTCAVQEPMSALPPKADICSAITDVRFGPKADIAQAYVCFGPIADIS